MKQNWLLPYQNPLTPRLGKEFFLQIPLQSGVYRFYGNYAGIPDTLLYVGKAKNLRSRICSYRHAKPGAATRKTLQLLWAVERIEWEIRDSEEEALLRENELLRSLRPPYNRANTSPEKYKFIALTKKEAGYQIRKTQDLSLEHPAEKFYGAFRSKKLLTDSLGALYRLLWICWESQSSMARFELPPQLMKSSPPDSIELFLAPSEQRRWEPALEAYLAGRSRGLLRLVTIELLQRSDLPPFYYRQIQEDLGQLKQAYLRMFRKNLIFCRKSGLAGSLVGQFEIDDYFVRHRATPHSRGKVKQAPKSLNPAQMIPPDGRQTKKRVRKQLHQQ